MTLRAPYYQHEGVTIYNGDCLAVLPELPDNSVDLILTDPPYFKVKGEAWDNQWDKPAEFLAWLDRVLAEFARVLKRSAISIELDERWCRKQADRVKQRSLF